MLAFGLENSNLFKWIFDKILIGERKKGFTVTWFVYVWPTPQMHVEIQFMLHSKIYVREYHIKWMEYLSA